MHQKCTKIVWRWSLLFSADPLAGFGEWEYTRKKKGSQRKEGKNRMGKWEGRERK